MTKPMIGAHIISAPFAVTVFGTDGFAILDVYKRTYVATGIEDRAKARIAAKALNASVCEYDDEGRLIQVYDRKLPQPLSVVGQE